MSELNSRSKSTNVWDNVIRISTILGLLLTSYTVYLNYQAVETNNKLNEYNVYIDIYKRLSTEKAGEIIAACSDSTISIDSVESESNFTGIEVTTLVLDLFEDISKLEDKNLISFESVDYAFGNRILQVGSNKSIVRYIDKLRFSFKDRRLYSGFQEEYSKLYNSLDVPEKSMYDSAFIKLQ